MKNINFISFFFLLFFNTFVFLNVEANIENKIIVKVGNIILTSTDLKNEIITNLVLDKKDINQININSMKSFAIKNLISKTIKRIEIDRYEIKDFNKQDLYKYLDKVAGSFSTNKSGLKKIFISNRISYDMLVSDKETELLWNTLIYQIYRNQININIVEVENEIKIIKEDKNEVEIKKIKENILQVKKQEKLNLFSRSHFSNLENTITINFQ
tara:strand:- start:1164 stop:1802 length:639 start_codon:yes stop_codon:yes gene_type:complete